MNLAMNGKTAPVVEDFFHNPAKFRRLALSEYGVLYGQPYLFAAGKVNIRSLKQMIFHRTVLPQFQQDTVLIYIHQLFGGILP